MKKTLLITIVSALVSVGAAFGQTQSITFDDLVGTADAGSYATTDTFNIQVTLTFSGYPNGSPGYSLWLETQTLNGFASSLMITGATYTSFTNPTDNGYPKAFTSTSGASSGFLTDADTVVNPQTGTIDQGDLGATSPTLTDGTYIILNLAFSITGATPGTYTLQSTVVSPKTSIVTDNNGFQDRPLGVETYTITIVPEPSTLALIGLTAVGGAFIAHRRRRALRG